MKFMHLMGVLLLGSAMVLTSCTKDEDTDPTATSPTISFGSGAGFLEADANVEQGTTFKVKIVASKGSDVLDEFTVYKDDVALTASEFKVNGVTAVANPVSIGAFDANSLSWEVEVNAVNVVATHEYRFQVQGADGPTSSVKLNITTFDPGTPVTTAMGIVFNADGPNMGSLDLNTGTVVSSNNPAADLHDMGINLGLPDATNWLQQVEPVNGATLRKAAGTVVFADIDTKEKIQAAYNASGADLAQSTKIANGDLYLVKKDADYFLVRFTKVNITTTNNLDNYEVDMKR
jgi:hypothetical protein